MLLGKCRELLEIRNVFVVRFLVLVLRKHDIDALAVSPLIDATLSLYFTLSYDLNRFKKITYCCV
jgi:hypothetical protein